VITPVKAWFQMAPTGFHNEVCSPFCCRTPSPDLSAVVVEVQVGKEPVRGCTDSHYAEFSPAAAEDDGSCKLKIKFGCTYSTFEEYDPAAMRDDGSCRTSPPPPPSKTPTTAPPTALSGCTYEDFAEFNPEATAEDGSCSTLVEPGSARPSGGSWAPGDAASSSGSWAPQADGEASGDGEVDDPSAHLPAAAGSTSTTGDSVTGGPRSANDASQDGVYAWTLFGTMTLTGAVSKVRSPLRVLAHKLRANNRVTPSTTRLP
jgi:hypothetical protein